MESNSNQPDLDPPGGEKQTFAVRRLAALAALKKIAKIVEEQRIADAAEKKWFPRVVLLVLLVTGGMIFYALNPKPVPHTHSGVTSRAVSVVLQFTQGEALTVIIPEGTRCIKSTRAFTPWIVDDISFLKDKSVFLVKYIKDSGLVVPEADIRDIKEEVTPP